MNGLPCSIYESKPIGNCSAGGISERSKEVTLLGVHRLDGTFERVEAPFSPSESAPPVIIQERKPCGKLYYSAYPCDDEGNALDGWFMSGGTFIATCDSRFPFDYPIPLHDRQEK